MTPGGRLPDEPGTTADEARENQDPDADWLDRFFAGPTDADRVRLRAELLTRAALVRTNGWEPYRKVWSTGELIGVAVLLESDAELAALGETVRSAWSRWAFHLWGFDGGQADVENGREATRQWFLDAATELGTDSEMRELLVRAAESPTVRRTRAHRGSHADRLDGAK